MNMLTLSNIPLAVYNRALELYGEDPEDTVECAQRRLLSAEGRKDITEQFSGITAFAQAVAEHMSSDEGYAVNT